MGLFWADQPKPDVNPQSEPQSAKYWLWAHPVSPKLEKPAAKPASDAAPSKCPVDHTKLMKKKPVEEPQAPPAVCPVNHSATSALSHGKDSLNPQNMMPELPQAPAPGQKIALPTERTISSIPKGTTDTSGNWEYPSPQQMLNAMVRKSGPQGIEEDAVKSMVDVHNFLNEGVWQEVLGWESKYTAESKVEPRLLQFQGRPQEMSPRAQMIQFLGKIFPGTWGCPPPFDRHDWTVLRADAHKADEWSKVRYVIDFYEAPDEGDMPAFSVDVRPALDSWGQLRDRVQKYLSDR